MRKWAKISIWVSGALVISAGIVALPFSLSMVGTSEFVFGNFQSYMSNDVMDDLQEEYDVNWQYYATNAEIPTYIKNKTLDAAVASNNMITQLAVEGEIQPIDWSKFNLWNSKENKPVKTYKDLKGVVSDATWDLCQNLAREAKLPGGDEANLLEYCIPYFMQNFVFAYRGPEIKELSGDNVSFKDIFDYITDKSIPDNRFLNGNSKVMMIKDARTTYDVAKIIEYEKNGRQGELDINPDKDSLLTTESSKNSTNAPSIAELTKTYDNISDYYSQKGDNKNTITFNSDSGIVLNKLASNEIKGAFLYNGDAIYSAAGGDVANGGDNLPNFSPSGLNSDDGFHVVIPKDNFVAMDGIVFNKSLSGKKLDEAYDLAKQISLSGLDSTNADGKEEKHDIGEVNSDDEYIYLSMKNFDFVNYTPCYQQLLDYVDSVYFGLDGDQTTNNLHKLQKKLLKIDPSSAQLGRIEMPVNNLTESNINLAFENFIDKI